MTEGFNWIYRDKPRNLSSKDRQEANIVSQQIKLQCFKKLQGNGVRMITGCGPDFKRLTIWEESHRVNDRGIDLGIMVETLSPDQAKEKISATEMFLFHTEGGYVVKETLSESLEKIESHEAYKSELEELLEVIKRGEEEYFR